MLRLWLTSLRWQRQLHQQAVSSMITLYHVIFRSNHRRF